MLRPMVAPMTSPIWQPSVEAARASQLAALHRVATQHHGVADSYTALHAWSCLAPEAFWPLLWDFLGIVGERGARVLVRGATMADAQWFPDARISFAENLISRRDDAIAIIAVASDGARTTLTFRELAAETARVAAGLPGLGVAPGDRVAAVLPNAAEAVIAM